MPNYYHRFSIICILFVMALLIALPQQLSFVVPVVDRTVTIGSPVISFSLFGREYYRDFVFKQGLDIQGGMQVVLQADMSEIDELDRQAAIDSAREIILRRVDLYGIAEPVVQTAQSAADEYRLIIELPGVRDPQQALQLVGQTAQLEFQLLSTPPPELVASDEAMIALEQTGLTGAQLRRSTVQFDPTTGEPTVLLEFDDEGRELFATVTRENVGQMLGIFIDGSMIMAPRINTPIIDGNASITGQFSFEEAQQLSIQLNAGALPIPISVLEQRSVGATLGMQAVRQSIVAGVVGFVMVISFMILYYGVRGVLASIALSMYVIFTLALYKTLGITMTLPGIAGLLLTIGMAVDANILIFERMKEEVRLGKPWERAIDLGFSRAWDSIRDANTATIMTALVLVNPMQLNFLNTSGAVRGFGITLLIGVALSLFTGVLITRTLLELFLSKPQPVGEGTKKAQIRSTL